MNDGDAETYDEVVESRARLLARADAGRRALQGELHDGAQQRLVHAVIALQLARAALGSGAPAADLLDEALANVEQANHDLRAVVHRILPRSLVHAGLGSGLRSAADELSVPVGLQVDVPRLVPEDEATAYEVALGLVRAAVADRRAGPVEVDVRLDGGTLVLRVQPVHPSADEAGCDHLLDVRDRVRAAGGRLAVAGDGRGRTAVRVELPVRVAAGPGRDLGAGRG